MNMRRRKDSARMAYIRILAKFAASAFEEPRPEETLSLELVNAGLLKPRDHWAIPGAEGITVEGRLFLQRLQEEEKRESLRHRVLKYLPIVIGYIAGFLSPLLTNWIASLFK